MQTGSSGFQRLPPGSDHVKAGCGFRRSTTTCVCDRSARERDRSRCRSPGVAATVQRPAALSVVDTTSTAAGSPPGRTSSTSCRLHATLLQSPSWRHALPRTPYWPSINGSIARRISTSYDGRTTTGPGERAPKAYAQLRLRAGGEVKTAAWNAEYGRLTGGAVNVLTKSGGNTVHGDIFGFGEGGGLQAANVTGSKLPQNVYQFSEHAHRADYGGDLGAFF